MNYFEFFVGKRRCMGEAMAKATLFMFTARIVQHFELKAPQGAKLPDMHQDGITISPTEFSASFIPRSII